MEKVKVGLGIQTLNVWNERRF